MMGVVDPLYIQGTARSVLQIADYAFLAIYVLEMLVKMMGFGLIFGRGEHVAYFRSWWNIFDFAIVILTLLAVIPAGANIGGIRVLRVVRVLRILTFVRAIRLQIQSMVVAAPFLLSAGLVFLIFFVTFSIMGVQVFNGKFRAHCVDPRTGEYELEQTCALPQGGQGFQCEEGLECRLTPLNPRYNQISFDNFGVAVAQIFQCVSPEFWFEIANAAMASTSTAAIIFFVFVLVLGTYVIVTLFRAVIAGVVMSEAHHEHGHPYDGVPDDCLPPLIGNAPHHSNMYAYRAYKELHTEYAERGLDATGIAAYASPYKDVPNNRMPDLAASAPHANLRGGEALREYLVLRYEYQARGLLDLPLWVQPISEAWLRFGGREVAVRARFAFFRGLRQVVESRPFVVVAALLVLFNFAILASEYYPQPENISEAWNDLNLAFNAAFSLEIVMKLVALGFVEWSQDTFNVFDFVIVMLSWIEIGLGQEGALAALRSLRILRLIRYVNRWRSGQIVLASISRAITGASVSLLFLFVYLYLFTIVGMEVFGGRFFFSDYYPSSNFDTFWGAFLSCFTVVTVSAWPDLLRDGIRAQGWGAAVFFILLFIGGVWIILNLFLAALIEAFEGGFEQLIEEEESSEGDPIHNHDALEHRETFEEAVPRSTDATSKVASPLEHAPPPVPARRRLTLNATTAARFLEAQNEGMGASKSPSHHQDESDVSLASLVSLELEHEALSRNSRRASNPHVPAVATKALETGADVDAGLAALASTGFAADMRKRANDLEEVDRKHFEASRPEGVFLGFMGPNHRLRRGFFALATWNPFHIFMFVMGVLSCVTIALENPGWYLALRWRIAFSVFEMVFLFTFLLEAILKVIAFGSAYFQSGWHCLELLVVALQLIACVLFYTINVDMRFVRMLRVFILAGQLRSTRRIISVFVQTIPMVSAALLIAFLLWTTLCIISVHLFAGRVGYCNDWSVPNKTMCAGPYLDPKTGIEVDREWRNPEWGSFDNLGSALLAMYPAVALTGWQDIMYSCMAITGVDQQPQRNASPSYGIFFVVFLIVGTWFNRSLFIGSVLETFLMLDRKEKSMGILLTEEQQQWVTAQRVMMKSRPSVSAAVPEHAVREYVYRFVMNAYFLAFMMIIILANTIVMAMQYADASETYNFVLDVINTAFVIIFVLEAVLKFVALGRGYFRDPWNWLDLFVVVTALVDIGVTWGMESQNSFSPSIFRVFRLVRLLTFFQNSSKLQSMMRTLLIAMPAVGNVMVLYVSVMCTFACIGVAVFGDAEFGPHYHPPATFQNFGTSLYMLTQITSGGLWEKTVYELSESHPGVYAFFYTYSLLTEMILLDLVVAVLLEVFYRTFLVTQRGRISAASINEFTELWAKFDPKATLYISLDDARKFLAALPPPLGPGALPANLLATYVSLLDIPIRVVSGVPSLYYADTLQCLADIYSEIRVHNKVRAHLQSKWKRTFPQALVTYDPSLAGISARRIFTIHEYRAALIIQRFYRSSKQAKGGVEQVRNAPPVVAWALPLGAYGEAYLFPDYFPVEVGERET